MPSPRLPDLDIAPWRLSGVVYGTLLNDPASLAALGEAVNAPPYKAAPRAPISARLVTERNSAYLRVVTSYRSISNRSTHTRCCGQQ